MAIYDVYFTERFVHHFVYEAESKEKAEEEFWNDLDNGCIDFSRGEVFDSELTFSEAG